MESIAVIFWSGTGNTATMAQEVVAGTGGQAKLINVTDTNADEAAAYDKLALGCPSMGDEVLEEDEMEPFFTAFCSAPTTGATASGCATGQSAPRRPVPSWQLTP